MKRLGRNYVARPRFPDYKEKFKDYFVMERKNGVIMLRMHTDGGPVNFNFGMHNAWGQAWHDVGNDPENEVMILTSTGSKWIGTSEEPEGGGELEWGYDDYYYDATKLAENLIFDVDFPTIAAVNGPGYHTEIALLCDITICAEEAEFFDSHFSFGLAPGDGQGLTFQELLGTKRAAYYLYTGKPIRARQALELGLVNEVVAADQLMDRAWEIADQIMKAPRVARRMTSQLLKRPWKRRLISDYQVHIAHEAYGVYLDKPYHPPFDVERDLSGQGSSATGVGQG